MKYLSLSLMVRVDFETINRGHGIFKDPSELHLDVRYQTIIHSTIRKWLIDSQPKSEEKQRLLNICTTKASLVQDIYQQGFVEAEFVPLATYLSSINWFLASYSCLVSTITIERSASICLTEIGTFQFQIKFKLALEIAYLLG